MYNPHSILLAAQKEKEEQIAENLGEKTISTFSTNTTKPSKKTTVDTAKQSNQTFPPTLPNYNPKDPNGLKVNLVTGGPFSITGPAPDETQSTNRP